MAPNFRLPLVRTAAAEVALGLVASRLTQLIHLVPLLFTQLAPVSAAPWKPIFGTGMQPENTCVG